VDGFLYHTAPEHKQLRSIVGEPLACPRCPSCGGSNHLAHEKTSTLCCKSPSVILLKQKTALPLKNALHVLLRFLSAPPCSLSHQSTFPLRDLKIQIVPIPVCLIVVLALADLSATAKDGYVMGAGRIRTCNPHHPGVA
jgi:hypothetical protein